MVYSTRLFNLYDSTLRNDVLRFFTHVNGAGEHEVCAGLVGANPTLTLGSGSDTNYVGAWIHITGVVDLSNGVSSGFMTNVATGTGVQWENQGLSGGGAAVVNGFSIYDPNGKTPAAGMSFENVSVVGIPPLEIGKIGVSAMAQKTILEWESCPGARYAVQYRTNLISSTWSTVASHLPGINRTQYMTNEMDSAVGFYQITGDWAVGD